MTKSKTNYMKNQSGEVFETMCPEYYKDCEHLPQKQGAELYRLQVISDLKNKIEPGSTVYIKVNHVSSSGMTRYMDFYFISENQLQKINHSMSVVLMWTHTDNGLKVKGCGMDMGLHSVYTLGRHLWPNGTPKPHGSRNGVPDSDGGYALQYSYL